MATTSKSATGLSSNVAAALCYVPVVGFVVSIIMLILEKNSEVKWNAVQALLLGLVVFVLDLILGATFILIALVPIVNVVFVVISLVLAYKAYKGGSTKLPVVSGWADKLVKKI